MKRQKLEASQSGLLDDESIDIRDILTSAVSRVPMVGGLLAEIVDPPEANAGASIIYGPEREENFKRWFGDSGMVDEEGNPLVMYHGTNTDFPAFEGSQMIWGSRGKELPSEFSFLSQNFAGGAANMVPIYMKGQSMFDADRIPKTTSIQDYVTELLEQSIERGREFTTEEEEQIANLEKTLADSAANQGYEYAPNYPRFHFWNYPELTFGDAEKTHFGSCMRFLGLMGSG